MPESPHDLKPGSEVDVLILLAEDDEDDYLLVRESFEEARLDNALHRVKDGRELLEYLDDEANPRPGIILLDLNMPRMDGREALQALKGHPQHRRIPVIVLTTSQADVDVLSSYELGANSYVQKPVEFESFIKALRTMTDYWFRIVTLPSEV